MFFLNRELLTIIGTAHVSEERVNEVKDAIYEQHPDIVAIELDRGRYIKIRNKMRDVEEDDNIQITRIIKENKVGLFLVSTLLGYFQSKIGAEVDVDPGSEMIGAIEACEDLNIPIALIDREINTTLQRALNKMGFMENGSWGPVAAKKMKAVVETMKDITIVDPVVTIRSTMNDANIQTMEELADALLA